MDHQNQPLYKKIQDYVFAFYDKVGKGNFSQVFKGIHQPTQKHVAIKVVELSSLNSQRLQELLKTETSILRKLDHINIIKCEQILSSARNCYIITQLCSDGTLEEKLKINGPSRQQELFTIVRDVYEGLKYLSKNSIVHRDIKISNILINKGVHKIGDFGFAKVSKFQFQDISIGSPIYMSPEGYIENIYGPKTDVWSFGILLIELLTGKPPFYSCFNENELKQLLLQQINIEKVCPHISKQLKELIMSCLKIDTRKRINMQDIENLPWMQKNIYETSLGKKLNEEKHQRERKNSFTNRIKNEESKNQTLYCRNQNLQHMKSIEIFKKKLQENRKKQRKQDHNSAFNLEKYKEKRNLFENKIKKEQLGSPTIPKKMINFYEELTDMNSPKVYKIESQKQNKNMSQKIQKREWQQRLKKFEKKDKERLTKEQNLYRVQKSINQQKQSTFLTEYQSPEKDLSLLFQKNKNNDYIMDNLSKTYGHGIKNIPKSPEHFSYKLEKQNKVSPHEIKKQEKQKVLNKKLNFAECINIIHYCRLVYKYAGLLAQQPNHDLKLKLFLMHWSVQILYEIEEKVYEGDIIYGKQETFIKNLSMNFEEESKNQEKKKKLKDVINEYIGKYSIKLKGKKQKVTLKYALACIKEHYSKVWKTYKQKKKQVKLTCNELAFYGYLYIVSEESFKFGEYCMSKRSNIDNRSLEKFLCLKIQSFSVDLIENISKNISSFDKN